jgi:histidine triad (HIT) family protein
METARAIGKRRAAPRAARFPLSAPLFQTRRTLAQPTNGVTDTIRRVTDCVFCDRTALRGADVYFENEWCVYASSRDPRDPPEVLPGSGIIVTKAHRSSPFDFSADEWAAIHELLLKAKAVQDARLKPDGYFLSWTSFPFSADDVTNMHAHLHVVPRFADEPRRDGGGRVGIKGKDNRRPDPSAPGNGWALLLGRR